MPDNPDSVPITTILLVYAKAIAHAALGDLETGRAYQREFYKRYRQVPEWHVMTNNPSCGTGDDERRSRISLRQSPARISLSAQSDRSLRSPRILRTLALNAPTTPRTRRTAAQNRAESKKP
ncbi:MAG: hypothetical protein GY935_01515 [Gammaproteobacteria bacterium]|nr:hypothetical protein [Gammaproteobacteria bacterium]